MTTLVNLAEVQARLGISRRSLYRLIAAKRLRPVHPTPGRTMFTEREVNAYIASLEGRRYREKVA
jgi:predicted DNA-binding transcriptional regulator AlpA